MAALSFLLVNPTSPLWRARAAGRTRGARSHRFSMLTSLYVAAAMPPGTRTRLVDEDVEPIDFDFPADLVGLSLMTYNAPRAYEVADEFRRRGRTVVMGGYHPSFMPDEAAAHADAVCVGEAEGTLPALVRDFQAGRLRPRYVSEPVDLRGLPVPDRGLLRRSAYITPDAVQATRGCPYACSFCSVTAFARRRFRARPVDEVIDELRGLGRWLTGPCTTSATWSLSPRACRPRRSSPATPGCTAGSTRGPPPGAGSGGPSATSRRPWWSAPWPRSTSATGCGTAPWAPTTWPGASRRSGPRDSNRARPVASLPAWPRGGGRGRGA